MLSSYTNALEPVNPSMGLEGGPDTTYPVRTERVCVLIDSYYRSVVSFVHKDYHHKSANFWLKPFDLTSAMLFLHFTSACLLLPGRTKCDTGLDSDSRVPGTTHLDLHRDCYFFKPPNLYLLTQSLFPGFQF